MPNFVIGDLDGDVLWDGEADSFADAVKDVLRFGCVDASDIDFAGHDLSGIPGVPCIDGAILNEIKRGGELDMDWWHLRVDHDGYCSTAHCRAGWAVTVAGKAGLALEDRLGGPNVGTYAAGALIYAASRPGVPVPDFYSTDDEAMEDLRACAGANP